MNESGQPLIMMKNFVHRKSYTFEKEQMNNAHYRNFICTKVSVGGLSTFRCAGATFNVCNQHNSIDSSFQQMLTFMLLVRIARVDEWYLQLGSDRRGYGKLW